MHPDAHANQQLMIFHEPEDLELLQAITLSDMPITQTWLEELSSAFVNGSVDLGPRVSNETREKAKHASATFITMLGIDCPEHPWYESFNKAYKNSQVVPKTLFSALKALHSLYDNPYDIGRRTPELLKYSGSVTTRHFNYLNRIADKLGWRGDVSSLISEYPELLLISEKKINVIARLALAHNDAVDPNMSNQDIIRLFRNVPVEFHLLAALTKQDYIFGDRISKKSKGSPARTPAEARDRIFTALEAPQSLQKIGEKTLKAYFLYRRPDETIIKGYPILYHLLSSTEKDTPRHNVIKGDESWLIETNQPLNSFYRTIWRSKFNGHIRSGSRDIAGLKIGTQLYEDILEQRLQFFLMLGWSRPDHPLFNQFNSLSMQREGLVSPEKVVAVLNLLSKHGVAPITNVLKSAFPILLSNLESLSNKIEYIARQNLDINATLQDAPSLLRCNQATLEKRLANRINSGRAVFRSPQ